MNKANGLERYIRTECLHTMTEGICCVFDSLKLASVINSDFFNVFFGLRIFFLNINIMINETVLCYCI